MTHSLPMPMQRGSALFLAFALVLGVLVPFVAPTPARASSHAWINEFHYNNTGTDEGEFIEVALEEGADLNGWSIVRYNGSTGAVYTIPSQTAENDLGLLTVTGTASGFAFVVIEYPANGLQNGPQDGIALVDDGGVVIQFLSYDGTFTAVGGPADGTASTDIGIAQTGDAAADPVGASLQLTGTGSSYAEFSWSRTQADSAGAINTGQSFGTVTNQPVVADCGDSIVTPEGEPATTTVSATDADGTVTDIEITAVNPAPSAGSIAVTAQSPATEVGGTAAATITVDADVPADVYEVSITATNDDAQPQTGPCTLNVTVEGAGGANPGIVISEFRVRGPAGGSDEFIELHNPTAAMISIGGWQMWGSNASAGTSSRTTIGDGVTIQPGCFYLLTNSSTSGGPYSGAVAGDRTYGTGITDTGGIAVFTEAGAIVDQVGLSAGSAYKEGTPLTSLGSPNEDRSYERVPGGADGHTDTNDNATDFALIAPSNPQNSDSTCIGATPADAAPEVVSTTPDEGDFYVESDASVSVEFSEAVDVGDGWYDIECTESGAHTASVSGGPMMFVLDPDDDFVDGDRCTVTITGELVTDVDTDDPPDAMAEDFVFGFHVGTRCTETTHVISDVQGDGQETTIGGMPVIIRGVVTADFTSGGDSGIASNQGLRGFFMEAITDDRDDDPQTSEGVFVFDFDGTFDGEIGDLVHVAGTAGEAFDVTQISSNNIDVCGDTGVDAALPAPAGLPLPLAPDERADEFEPLESMRVTHEELTVIEFFQLERFGEIRLSAEGVLQTPTNVHLPGTDEAIELAEFNAAVNIVLDDGRTGQNLDRLDSPDLLPYVAAGETLRIGDQLTEHTTVLHFNFGQWKLQPVDIDEITDELAENRTRPRPEFAPDVGGTLNIASFNVLNYFDGDGQGGGFPNARGAVTASELERQTEKLVDAITRLDADILGLIEIENDGGEFTATRTLVDAINAELGAEVYRFVDTGVIGTDAIKQAFIYDRRTVRPVGPWAILTSEIDLRFDDSRSRPALAQTFTQLGTGERVTVVVNHFKSKGQSGLSDETSPDFDRGDGQGFWNHTRTQSAIALAEWLDTNPTRVQSLGTLIIGDLNAYGREDPIRALEDAGYVDQLIAFTEGTPYTYTFDGQQGTLDTALAKGNLASRITGADVWHINADEVPAIDYQESEGGVSFNRRFRTAGVAEEYYDSSAFRSSDHDPVLVGLNLGRRDFPGRPGAD